jgi:hypothetical protein
MDRFRHRIRAPKGRRYAQVLLCGGIGLWRDAGALAEDAMEVEGTEPGLRRKLRERRRFLGCIDQGAGAGYGGEVRIGAPGLIGPAALAGTQAGFFGVGGAVVKRQVFRPSGAGGAARLAIDARGDNAEDKLAVKGAVAATDGFHEDGMLAHDAQDGAGPVAKNSVSCCVIGRKTVLF